MINMFGESSFKDLNLNMDDIEMRKINLHWVDYSHYSARQQTSMMLGGLMGEIELSGNFSSPVLMLLDFAENFSAGKNVVFGQIRLFLFGQNMVSFSYFGQIVYIIIRQNGFFNTCFGGL